MKWLFLFIVLGNAVFLGWHRFIQDKPQQVRESAYGPPVSEKIHLLSEEPAVTEKDYNAGVVSSENLEEALNKLTEQLIKDERNLFCPHIEIERQEDQAQIIKALTDSGWLYQVTKGVGKRERFWLYVAAPETPEKANQIVKELASKSVDSFVINRSEMKNRISLGLYSSENRANQAKKRIEKLSGYDVDVYEHMRNVSLQQIDVEQPINEKDWEQFVSQFDLGKMMIKLEKNPC